MAEPLRRGLSLIEILIVIAVIGLLLALSSPAIQASREAARLTQCKNNLRQFGMAFSAFESQKGQYPSSFTVRVRGPLNGDSDWQFFNYFSEILPYLEAAAVANNYHSDKVFCDPSNLTAIAAPLPVAICPSAPGRDPADASFKPSLVFPKKAREHKIIAPILGKLDAKYSIKYTGAMSDYSVITEVEDGVARLFGYDIPRDDPAGLRGMFPSPFAIPTKDLLSKTTPLLLGPAKVEYSVHLRAADVIDGLSHTVLMTEDAGRPERWEMGAHTARGEPLESAWAAPMTVIDVGGRDIASGKCLMQCDNDGEIYSFHSSGVNFVFADGHVATMSKETEQKVLLAIISPDRGEAKLESH